jgi:hypothetical protein
MENIIKAAEKSKIRSSIRSRNTTPRIYPKKWESSCNKDTCTSMFIVALFIIVKLWKQATCSTTDEWVKKMWHLYTMEFYSATKKNEILSFAGEWMELENIISSKVSQVQKPKRPQIVM